MKKWIFILALLGVAGYAGFQMYQKRTAERLNLGANARPTNAVVKVRDLHFTVSAAGEITPAEQVSVRPEVNGKIAELPVDIGDKVAKGALLFRLDDEDLKIERTSQLTAIERARLELERFRRVLERTRRLYEDRLVSKEAYEDAQTEYDLARNSLERAQNELSLIEDRLSKTKIVAPFDCTILTRPISVGQAVSGSGGFNSGTEVLTIADLNALIINAHVNIADVVRLKVGQEVDVLVEALPGTKLVGRVERISPQASFKNSIKGYTSRIVLKNVADIVRPGMTANVAIPVASANQVLTVPIASVFTEMGQRYVFLQKQGRFEKQLIDVGVSDYEFVEVKSGLAAGDVVSLEQVAIPDKEETNTATVQRPRQSETSTASSSPQTSTNSKTATAAASTGTSNSSPTR